VSDEKLIELCRQTRKTDKTLSRCEDRDFDAIRELVVSNTQAVTRTPSTTIEGLKAKARLYLAYAQEPDTLAVSIMRDVLALAGENRLPKSRFDIVEADVVS
jgi:hypothetical protein